MAKIVPDHKSFQRNLRPDFSGQQSAEDAGNLHQVAKAERKVGRKKMGQIPKNFCGRVLIFLLLLSFLHAAGPIAIYGVKTLSSPLDATSLRDLAYIGIEYTFNTPLHPAEAPLSPREWERGVVLLSDFQQSEELFQKWIEFATILPKKIIYDDESSPLIELQCRNNLKNREFGEEGPQNFRSERATIAERQGASENGNFEINPTWPKTDSSSYFGRLNSDGEKGHVVVLSGALAEEVHLFDELIDKLLGRLPFSVEDEFMQPLFPK